MFPNFIAWICLGDIVYFCRECRDIMMAIHWVRSDTWIDLYNIDSDKTGVENQSVVQCIQGYPGIHLSLCTALQHYCMKSLFTFGGATVYLGQLKVYIPLQACNQMSPAPQINSLCPSLLPSKKIFLSPKIVAVYDCFTVTKSMKVLLQH